MKIRSQPKRKRSSKPKRLNIGLSILLVPLISVFFWVGYKQLESFLVKPKAILVLGGDEERERFAAQFARQHPNIPLWVSSGSPEDYAKRVFDKAGIDRDRVNLDYEATDTVTNFTSLVDRLEAEGINSVYLITSDYHMRRARVIGEIVFGSRGIVLKPVAIPTQQSPEPIEKAIRDGGRAILWVTTGYTGATLGKSLEQSYNP